jgi:hypothetical protein
MIIYVEIIIYILIIDDIGITFIMIITTISITIVMIYVVIIFICSSIDICSSSSRG